MPGIGIIDRPDRVGGSHQGWHAQDQQPTDSQGNGDCRPGAFPIINGLLIVHCLAETWQAEEQEDDQGQQVGAEHRVHRQGPPRRSREAMR